MILLRVILGYVLIFFLNIFPITGTRISQINQFMADLKANRIAPNQIEPRALQLKSGLSKRDLRSPQIELMDEMVAQVIEQQKKEAQLHEIPSQEVSIQVVQEVPSQDTGQEVSVQVVPQKKARQISSKKIAPKKEQPESYIEKFNNLVKQSQKFSKKIAFPTTNNLVTALGIDEETQKTIVHQMETTYPIMHHKTIELIDDFLRYKKTSSNDKQKQLYASLNFEQFVDRLLQKRPLMFMTAGDQYLLRDGKTRGSGGFELIGTDQEKAPLLLRDYLSYDEMQIAALIGMSVPTYFINKGDRNNAGINGQEGTFEKMGVHVGLVGARFEKPGLMEWAHMIVTQEQNKPELGYGKNPSTPNPLLEIWQKFYDVTFPSYQEAQEDVTGRYKPFQQFKYQPVRYFDIEVYKKRMQMVIEPFLLDAERRGNALQQKVYVHAVGLGLGVWQVLPEQGQWLVDVYADVMKKRSLPHIADIDFSWFPETVTSCGGVKNGGMFKQNNNNITIHFSKRDPAAKLTGVNGGKLLIAQYAWDGNTYPGNEYWAGMLTASGDPAAASCSTIPELQNPEINQNVSGKQVRFMAPR